MGSASTVDGDTHIAERSLSVDGLDTLSDGTGYRRAVVIKRGSMLGRYVVLEQLGAGGMGVVYSALDPDLDRKVALKLLHRTEADAETSGPTGGHARLLREAQALAKLNHPNVVTVHDVGEHEGHVYLTMEHVSGVTLTQWARTIRPWPAVLEVLLHAGAGLVAAHAQGLVHRDFKPDNVMVGDDGRVRVMDFGLARRSAVKVPVDPDPHIVTTGGGVGDGTAFVGTPAYMAPEQHLMRDADARSDQFAFCVSAWQAFFGERPFAGETLAALVLNVCEGHVRVPPATRKVPSAVEQALRRGLATDPSDRFPSIEALLDALRQVAGRARRRRQAIGVGAFAFAIVGALGLKEMHERRLMAECDRVAEEVATTWPVRAEAVRTGLLATNLPFAPTTAEKLAPWIDEWAAQWADARRDVCVRSTIEETLEPETERWAKACLDLRRAQVDGLLDSLEASDRRMVAEAVTNAAAIEPSDDCTDHARLHRAVWPEDERLAAVLDVRRRAFALLAASKAGDVESAAAARTLLSEAETIGFAPLVAEVRVALGRALPESEPAEAEAELRRAYFDAVRLDLPVVAANSALRLEYVIAVNANRIEDTLEWSEHAETWIDRLGETEGLLGAELASVRAVSYRVDGKYDEARRHGERAVALREAILGPEHPDVASALQSIGIALAMQRQDEAALAHFQRVLSIREGALGENHPLVWGTWSVIANVRRAQGNLEEAAAINRRILGLREAAFGPEHVDVAASLNNLGNVIDQLGDHTGAMAMHERALQIREKLLGPHHPEVGLSLTNLSSAHLRAGRPDRALPYALRAMDVRERVLGPDHPELATALHNVGTILNALGRYLEAEPYHDRALRIRMAALGPDHPGTFDSLSGLAQVYLRTGRVEAAEDNLQRVIAFRIGKGQKDDRLADAYGVMADLELQRGNAKAAIAAFESGLAVVEGAPGEWRTRAKLSIGLAEVLVHTGNKKRARVLASSALAAYRERGDPKAEEVAAWIARKLP